MTVILIGAFIGSSAQLTVDALSEKLTGTGEIAGSFFKRRLPNALIGGGIGGAIGSALTAGGWGKRTIVASLTGIGGATLVKWGREAAGIGITPGTPVDRL